MKFLTAATKWLIGCNMFDTLSNFWESCFVYWLLKVYRKRLYSRIYFADCEL